jgi:branched-chain amino acid transport system permease protein
MGELAFVGSDFLGGASGLSLPADKGLFTQLQFGGERGNFYALLVTAGLCILANLLILNSRLGYQLRAMRDNANAAQAMGVDLLKSKIVAMMISAVLTSIVGTIYARYSGFVDPYQMASPHSSVEVVLYTTIGGLGTVFGPLVGAGVLVAFGEVIRGYLGGVLPGLHFLITGVVIIAVILLMPGGVVPKIAQLWRERKSKAVVAAAPVAERVPS